MKILFICKHNRFRSKVAETIFNKLNKNKPFLEGLKPGKSPWGKIKTKKINAESAGISGHENPTAENVIKVLKNKGYEIKNIIPRRVDFSTINNYDLLVIDADNVDPLFFKDSFKGKIIWWKISDCDEKDIKGIKERVDEIEEKVKGLVKEMN